MMDESKVKGLITKWRESTESCDQTGLEQDVVCGACLLNCADELEAALAESGAGQAQIDAERKIACRAIEWESCPCSDTKEALKSAIEEWRALAQPVAAKEKEVPK